MLGYMAFGAIILAIVIAFMTYNRLVTLRQNVRESWSGVETELKRRFDLIPNLVQTVKGYATHERETLDAVITARNAAQVGRGTVEQQEKAQAEFAGAIGRLIALSEAYPDLKANQNFISLSQELQNTETRISQARRFYNGNVREMNICCESFPGVIFARSFGFASQPYFFLEDPSHAEAPVVSFDASPSPPQGGQSIKIKSEELEERGS